MPSRHRNSVDLPAPFAPSNRVTSPACKSNDTSDSAFRPPKRLLSPRTESWAVTALVPAATGAALVPVVTPRGDLDDQNILSATDALAGAQAKLQFMADRYQAGDVVVDATLGGAGCVP